MRCWENMKYNRRRLGGLCGMTDPFSQEACFNIKKKKKQVNIILIQKKIRKWIKKTETFCDMFVICLMCNNLRKFRMLPKSSSFPTNTFVSPGEIHLYGLHLPDGTESCPFFRNSKLTAANYNIFLKMLDWITWGISHVNNTCASWGIFPSKTWATNVCRRRRRVFFICRTGLGRNTLAPSQVNVFDFCPRLITSLWIVFARSSSVYV